MKVRDLKDERGTFETRPVEWTEPMHLGQLSYIELEQRLAEIPS